MKKIVYGITILLGILAIGSNFLVDNSLIDHKTVKAGGTSCRWISDTGYGVGPIYRNTSISSETWAQFSIMKCNTSTVDSQKKFGIVYASATGDTKYNTTNGVEVGGDYYKFVEGKAKECTSSTSCTGSSVNFYLTPVYSVKVGYSYIHGNSASGVVLPDYMLPTQYTCVCAEY